MPSQLFGNFRVWLYNVDPWDRLGFGVPSYGQPSQENPGTIDTMGTLNQSLWTLVDEIGRIQLFIMTHVDAQRTQPPSINTVMRMAKMLNRVQSVFGSEVRDYPQQRLEAGHQTPDLQMWNIHPVPYFPGPALKNTWLARYNKLTMTALTNLMCHSDNRVPLTITAQLVADVYPYFAEISRLVGVQLLGLPLATVLAPGFMYDFTLASPGVPSGTNSFANYHPDAFTINLEGLDGPGDMTAIPTAPDLGQLFKGIPANMIYPNLVQYPIVPAAGGSDLAGADTLDAGKSAAGTGGVGGMNATAIGPAGSTPDATQTPPGTATGEAAASSASSSSASGAAMPMTSQI